VEAVEVDGSQGEGGGQILRTAIAFSAIVRRPVRVVKVRAGREVPGLRRQHASVLRILAGVFGGKLEGAQEGSTTVSFAPGRPGTQSYEVDMGTAASITLVLQAVVPAVALGGSGLRLDLVGGTDVPWSPTFDYFQRVVTEGYRAVGINVQVSASRRGYYPRGGGRVTAVIQRCGSVVPLELTSRPGVGTVDLISRCGELPRKVAERQADAASAELEKSGIRVGTVDVIQEGTDSPGTSILAYHVGTNSFLGSDALGERGKLAEEVGREAAARFVSAASSGACFDAHLGDMIIPFLSLGPGPSRISVPEVTPHLVSGLRLAEQFTSCTWSADAGDRSVCVTVFPSEG
jgi:RNA 3'-phosphate cyclase